MTVDAPADRYRRLAARFTSVVAAVPADAWSSMSPCDGWTAADVVDHVVSTQADMLGRMPFGSPVTDAPADRMGAWTSVRDRMQSALDDPDRAGHSYDGYFGPTTFAQTVDTFYSFDLVVHVWDLARATGLRDFEAIDRAEIARIVPEMEALGPNLRQPGLVGPPIDLGTEADEQTVFLAFLGRRA